MAPSSIPAAHRFPQQPAAADVTGVRPAGSIGLAHAEQLRKHRGELLAVGALEPLRRADRDRLDEFDRNGINRRARFWFETGCFLAKALQLGSRDVFEPSPQRSCQGTHTC